MISRYFSLIPVNRDILGELDAEPSNITDLCPYGNEWIWNHFGQCVSDQLQWASFIIGFISLVTWFFPSLPQIYQNYKRGSCEEALSPIFLFLWFFGDSMNLTGAILTHQLPVQIYVGGYYIIQDCIVLGQFVYYKAKNRWRVRLEKDLGTSGPRVAVLNGVLLGGVFMLAGNLFYSKSSHFIQEDANFQSRVLLAPIFNGATDEVGFACGAISAISYLSGRIPQLMKNYKRRSTEGVSIAMYVLVCLGNATYGASVILGCDGDTWTYFARHLPWLIGSLACLSLDSLVFIQYFRYRKTNDHDLLPIIDGSMEDESGSVSDPCV